MSYHNSMLSNLYLFEVCSLPTVKPKSRFLGYLKDQNCLYAMWFLYLKVSLVIHYSEHSSESVGGFVSYFNYLSTWWLLFPSVHWNFCMRSTGLNIFCLLYSWLAIFISVFCMQKIQTTYSGSSDLYWLMCFLILLEWISDSYYNNTTVLKRSYVKLWMNVCTQCINVTKSCNTSCSKAVDQEKSQVF